MDNTCRGKQYLGGTMGWRVGGAALNSSTTVADNNSGFVGGDAGDYASVIVDVTPGENIDVQTGKGGNAGPPGNTSIFVSLPSRSYAVGRQASMINYTVNGSTVTPVPGIVQFVAGGDGKRTEFTFAQSSATQYRKVYTGGDGGDAYPAQKGGKGLTFSFDMATGGILVGSLVSALGSVGSSPGAGGGIGFGNISSGGSGLVIIHW